MNKIKSAIADYLLFFRCFLLNKYKGLVVVAFFMGLFSTIVSSVGLGLYLPVISTFFNTGETTDFFTRLSNSFLNGLGLSASFLNLLFVASFTIIIGAFLNYFTFLLSGYLFVYTYREVKDRLISRLLANNYAFFTKEKVGKIVLGLTEQANKASSSVETVFRLFIHSMLALGYVVALFIISVKLTLSMAVFGVIGLVVSLYLGHKMETISTKLLLLKQMISSFFTETIVGIKTIKGMGFEQYRHDCVRELLTEESKTMFKAYACNYLSPLTTGIISAVFGFVCIYIGLFWFSLKAEIIIFLVVTIRLNSSMYFMNQAWVHLAESLPNISSVLEYFSYGKSVNTLKLLNNRESKISSKNADSDNLKFRVLNDFDSSLPPISLENSIKIKNVFFSYSADLPVLQGVNIEIKKNQFIALVGPSGGGKSTLVDLLLGLYVPDQGEILFDGKSLADYRHHKMAEHVGVVSQDIFLFNTSIAENISYGDKFPNMEKIEHAGEMAHAANFIQEMKDGYNSIIGDRGVMLSGGQRQRVALARALYNKPDLLILDEATSALDTESEQLIQESLEEIYGQLTIVAIAHRLSTIKKADKIFYIDKGRVIESGTHEELIRSGKSYKKLCEIQFS